MNPKRQPEGAPRSTGGQFAPSSRPAADTAVVETADAPVITLSDELYEQHLGLFEEGYDEQDILKWSQSLPAGVEALCVWDQERDDGFVGSSEVFLVVNETDVYDLDDAYWNRLLENDESLPVPQNILGARLDAYRTAQLPNFSRGVNVAWEREDNAERCMRENLDLKTARTMDDMALSIKEADLNATTARFVRGDDGTLSMRALDFSGEDVGLPPEVVSKAVHTVEALGMKNEAVEIYAPDWDADLADYEYPESMTIDEEGQVRQFDVDLSVASSVAMWFYIRS